MSTPRFVWELIKRTFHEILDDDCLHMAAGIAYYTLFSLFPLVLGLIAVLGVILEPEEVQEQAVAALAEYLPGSSNLVAATLSDVVASRRTLGLLAVLGLFWSASAVFAAVRRSLNRAFEVERQRPLVKQKLVELAMIAGAGTLLLISLSTGVVLQFFEEVTGGVIGRHLVRDVGLSAAGFAANFLVVLMVYRFVPNTTVRWSDVWPAALLVAIVFEAGKRGFLWYLETRAIESYSLTYGPLTAVIVFLLWAYLSALVLLVGAELASEYSRLRAEVREAEPAWSG